MNMDKEADKCIWLPYKALNEENNSSMYKILITKNYGVGSSAFVKLQLSDLEIPNEVKVMEVKEHSVLNGEIESSQESFLKKFECKKYSEYKIQGRVNNIKMIQDKPNLVAVSNFTREISIFDTNTWKPDVTDLDFSPPVLTLTDKESTSPFVRKLFCEIKLAGIWPGLESSRKLDAAFMH